MLKQHTFDHLAVSVVNPRHGLPGLSVSGACQVHPVMGAGAYSHQTRLGIIFSSLRVADLLHLLRVLQHPFGAAAPLSSSRTLLQCPFAAQQLTPSSPGEKGLLVLLLVKRECSPG